jgi:hypothetical protein
VLLWKKGRNNRFSFKKQWDTAASTTGAKIYGVESPSADVFLLFIGTPNDYRRHRWISRYFAYKYSNVGIYQLLVTEDTYRWTPLQEKTFWEKNNSDGLGIFLQTTDLEKYFGHQKSHWAVLDKHYHITHQIESFSNSSRLELEKALKKTILKSPVRRHKNFTTNSRTEEYLFYSLDKVIVLDNFDAFKFPLLAVLDSSARRILLLKFDGEILYILEDKNFCWPSDIKYWDNKLFVADACNASINYITSHQKKFEILVNSEELYGIDKIEFLDKNNFVFRNNIGLWYQWNGKFLPYSNGSYGEDQKKHKNSNNLFSSDTNNQLLHIFQNNNQRSIGQITLDDEIIDNLDLNSPENTQIMMPNNHRERHPNDIQKIISIFQKSTADNRDIGVYRDIFWFLQDNQLQKFDSYNGTTSNILPYISSNTRHFLATTQMAQLDIRHRQQTTLQQLVQYIKPNKIENPSFLLLLQRKNNQLLLEKSYNYLQLRKNRWQQDLQKLGNAAVLYGHIYHGNGVNTRLKKIYWIPTSAIVN